MNAPAIAVLTLSLAVSASTPKEKTGRAVIVETVVDASPAEVFRLWTTEQGTRSFFAPDGHVEARAGGRYEMIFNPAGDPEGARAGTRGAKVLRFEPDRRLDFEWSVGVPAVSWDLKDTDFTRSRSSRSPAAPMRRASGSPTKAFGAAEAGTPPTRTSRSPGGSCSTGSRHTARTAESRGEARRILSPQAKGERRCFDQPVRS
jgi:uncharacterized protein YndB with AHSA1/START domain